MTTGPELRSPVVRQLAEEEIVRCYRDLRFPRGDGRPYVALNTVASVDGKVSVAGRSGPLSSRLDRHALRLLRARTDGVVVGAGTLRAEEIEFRFPPEMRAERLSMGLSPCFYAIIVTASGSLPVERRIFRERSPEVQPVVLTTLAAAPEVRRRVAGDVLVLAHGEALVDLKSGMEALFAEHGLTRLMLEGGPTLSSAMLAADLVDEVFCTLAAKLVGGPGGTMIGGAHELTAAPRPLSLLWALGHNDDLYLRYKVLR